MDWLACNMFLAADSAAEWPHLRQKELIALLIPQG
jgi:hypothetical protein